MKKIVLITLISAIFLISCTNTNPQPPAESQETDDRTNETSQTEEPEKTVEERLQNCSEDDLVSCYSFIATDVNDYKICNKLDEENKKNCLYVFVANNAYWQLEDNADPIICEEFNNEDSRKDECYWLIAMKTKNKELCENISKESKNDTNDGYYITKENCNNDIFYKKEGAQWNLIQGFPPYADPSRIYYEGNAEVRGWIVYVPYYVGEPEAHFHVAEKDIENLPPSMQKHSNFVLGNYNKNEFNRVSESVINQLEKFDENNPAKIKINYLNIYMEGSPSMGLVEILTSP